MKKVIFIGAAMLLGMMMVCTTVDAQTRKEKKAAKSEAYKNEQRRIQEEKELIHQVRMDSIANAKKGFIFITLCSQYGKDYYLCKKKITYGAYERIIEVAVTRRLTQQL